MRWTWLSFGKRKPQYRVFTTVFDTVLSGEEITKNLSLPEQEVWDAQIEQFRLATEIARTKAGLASLSHVETVKGRGGFDPQQTVVSVLVDHSGSLKGQRAIIACFTVQIIADFLTRIGVPFEILGFTTVEWKGGRSRKRWIERGRPKSPGRLNDLLHIVYRKAADSNPGAPYTVHHLLRDAILKENIDGEALIWTAKRLEKQKAARKVVLVVSDGAPVDDATLSANTPDYLFNHFKEVTGDIAARPDFRLAGICIDYPCSREYPEGITVDCLGDVSDNVPSFLARLF